jgi:uncharacterized delta-60 repeat protein
MRPLHARPRNASRPRHSSWMRRSLLLPLSVAVLLAWQLVLVAPAQAAAGDLDPSFGVGGKVTTDFGFAISTDRARAVVAQADGKLVAAGVAFSGTSDDFALVRYSSDGSLDAGFGTGGKVMTDFADGFSSDQADALARQADGKLVAAGSSFTPTGNDFAVARYLPNGTLDPSFGTGGKVTTDFGSDDVGHALVMQPDGKLVVAGTAGGNFALARYRPNGRLDPSFGPGGKVTTDFGGTDEGLALALQADGRLVVAGIAGPCCAFGLARYRANGMLDRGFGTGGKVTTTFGGLDDRARAVVVQADGKLVAAGYALTETSRDFALARYLPNGSLDAGFGTGGKVTTDFTGFVDEANGVAVQPDGRLVAVGVARFPTGLDFSDFALARYEPNGSLDAGFGTGGKLTTDFGGGEDLGQALAVQADGRLVAAGLTATPACCDFALARYLAR